MSVAHPRISIDPQYRFGKARIAGTRICVADILGWIAAGESWNVIKEDYLLTDEDIRAALLFAGDVLSYRPLQAEYARRMGSRPYGDPFLDGDGERTHRMSAARV